MSTRKKTSPTATAIIVAAGESRRMGDNNKQFILIDDMPVLAHTLLKFHDAQYIDSIIIVTKEDYILTVWDMVREFGISKVTDVIPGGKTRGDSVKCGLQLVPNNKLVAIHDGARPFVSPDKINELVLMADSFGASAPGVIPKDTVKHISQDGNVKETINRDILRLIQTPQVFRSEEIKLAYIRADESGFAGTDDCSVAENAGFTVHIADGEYTNIKVTTPEDIPVAEAIHHFLSK